MNKDIRKLDAHSNSLFCLLPHARFCQLVLITGFIYIHTFKQRNRLQKFLSWRNDRFSTEQICDSSYSRYFFLNILYRIQNNILDKHGTAIPIHIVVATYTLVLPEMQAELMNIHVYLLIGWEKKEF